MDYIGDDVANERSKHKPTVSPTAVDKGGVRYDTLLDLPGKQKAIRELGRPFVIPYFQNSKLSRATVTFGEKLYFEAGQYFAGKVTDFGS